MTISRRLLVCLTLLSQPGAAANLWSKDGHEIGFNGYLRTGVGTSGAGHTQTCFHAPGASFKYRLGNECENYASIGGYLKFALPENRFVDYLKYEYQTSFDGDYGHQIDPAEANTNYVEIGNIANTSAKVWFGRRETFQQDVHIIDYNYMNIAGDGLGIYDIPAGPAKLHYAFFSEELNQNATAGRVRQDNHDIGVRDIKTNRDGTLAIDLRVSRIFGNSSTTTDIHSADGWSLALRHKQENFFGGTNTMVVQYGAGTARSAFAYPFEADWVAEELVTVDSVQALEDAQTFRILNTHLHETNRWAFLSLVLLEVRNSQDFDTNSQVWVSAGIRPTWFIDDNWRLTGEIGLDYIRDRTDQTNGYLLKQTLAVEWAPQKSFFSRPVLRAFVTRADWSNSFKGDIGAPYYADATHGWTTGLQVEYWW